MRSPTWIAVPPLLMVLCLAGCLKRTETITILPDGQVAIDLEYEGGSNDAATGDAMPSEAAGWKIKVERRITGKDNGEPTEDTIIKGEATFPPGAELPFTFADPDDPDFDLYLQFPTTLTIERRPDGVYYHFRRTYPARRYAFIENFYRANFEEDLEKVERKSANGEELTGEDRRRQLEAAVAVEMNKMEVFANQAFHATTPEAPQDGWLKVWEDLRKTFESIDLEELLELFERIGQDEDNEAATQALTARAQELEAQVMDTCLSGLEEYCGYSLADTQEFLWHYQQAEKEFNITEDLGDDAFEIIVVLPGRVVAANSTDRDGKTQVTWEFGGSDFYDRDVILMASSVVPYGQPEADADVETGAETEAPAEVDRKEVKTVER